MYTVLVNSSDGFDDCWTPFFTLFKKYWPACEAPIVLNTEFKPYENSELNVNASQVNLGISRKLTWSECLIEALKKIDTPIILYFQEDYFLEKKVMSETINDFAALMEKNSNIKYIGLTDCCNSIPFEIWEEDNRLWKISRNAKYRISTQCGLWDKKTLMSYLRPEENGWMFEIFGTHRAKKRDELFLTFNRNLYNTENPIVYYQVTGIIKGKWLSTIPALFKKEDIKMDFTLRGFYKEQKLLVRKIETFKKILVSPIKLIKGLSGL